MAAAACGGDAAPVVVPTLAPSTAQPSAEAPSPATESTDDSSDPMDLSSVCPNPLVVQTDWFPESEHGAMYELIGDGYIVDVENKIVRGRMQLGGRDLGIAWEVRTGGPAIGFSSPALWMATDDGVHLGYANTEDQIKSWGKDIDLVSVVAPLEKNPQMIMWDPATYPDIETIADLGEAGVTINVFGGGTFPEVFIAQGIWAADQVDPSYNGSPARFVAENGAIAQQGFASSEVYTYEHVYEEWGNPVSHQLINDAGFRNYSQTVAVRREDLPEMRACLERVVPIIQQATVDYYSSPERANAIIVDAVGRYQDFWVYPVDLAEFSVNAQLRFGLAGNGPDDIVGNMEESRIQEVLDSMRAAAEDAPERVTWEIDPALSAADVFTNEFIDPSIGFEP